MVGVSQSYIYAWQENEKEENIGWCLENLAMPFNKNKSISQVSLIANSKMVWLELLGFVVIRFSCRTFNLHQNCLRLI